MPMMPVMEYAQQIADLNARIAKIMREKSALEKRMQLLKKRGILDENKMDEFNTIIEHQEKEIEALRRQIRNLENEQLRSKNLS